MLQVEMKSVASATATLQGIIFDNLIVLTPEISRGKDQSRLKVVK